MDRAALIASSWGHASVKMNSNPTAFATATAAPPNRKTSREELFISLLHNRHHRSSRARFFALAQTATTKGRPARERG